MSFVVLDHLLHNFKKFPDRNAFFIGDKYYTYSQFNSTIAGIQGLIREAVPESESHVGLATYDDLYTYASIYALWFSGKAFIPVNPRNPNDRNAEIQMQTGIRYVLSSDTNNSLFPEGFTDCDMIDSNAIATESREIESIPADMHQDAYVLFTSGSTGKPKGVPVSRNNLGSFVESFMNAGYDFTENDRFLQIYDLSFDASVHCYTVPLTAGGCIYTVPPDKIKYLYAYKLMKEKDLTFVKMPPSTLAYLQPYFSSIKLDKLKFCLLGGEAFPSDLAGKWSECAPHARIQNVYGPTEATINTHIYNWKKQSDEKKSFKGIVSIGKCFGDSVAMVVDEDLNPVSDGDKGELCLGGPQVVKGYWNDEEKSKESFFTRDHQGEKVWFYRTGDLALRDEDGDYMFLGRLDSQVQIQGYRVELGEIEKHARDCLAQLNVAAVPHLNEHQGTEITLFIENASGKESFVLNYLEGKVPPYMVPGRVINLDIFPKSSGGKINRSELLKLTEQ